MLKMFNSVLIAVFSFLCFSTAWANLFSPSIQFPRDEAAHYSATPHATNNFTEWWFYNGKLTAENGRQFGYYISYFYMQTEVNGKQVPMPQFVMQIVDLKKQKTYAYGIYAPLDTAHFATDKLDIALGKALTLQKLNNSYVLNGVAKSRQGAELQFALQLTPTRDALLTSDKDRLSYAATHLVTAGTLQIGKEKFVLNPAKSVSWMDHQWGNFVVTPGESQWMWASVQLENGLELNLNMPIDPDTKKPVMQKVHIVLPNGKTLATTKFTFTPHLEKGHKYPLKYDLSIPEINLHLALNALSPKQDANEAWEGINDAQGTYNGSPIKGQAFTENTVIY